MLKSFRLIFFAALFTACAMPSSPTEQEDKPADIAALTKAKIELWPSFYKNQDAEGLANFLHPDFIFITDTGSRSSYTEEVDWVRNNPWSGNANDDFVYHIEDIIFLGPDTAIIYGKGTSTRQTEDGRPCDHSYWSSNTLRRTGDRWRPSFSHVSGVKCTPRDTATPE